MRARVPILLLHRVTDHGKAGVVISTSRSVVAMLSGFETLRGRISHLPDGVDQRRFNPAVSGDEVRRRHGIGSRALVEAKFDLDTTVSRLQSIYDVLLSASEGK